MASPRGGETSFHRLSIDNQAKILLRERSYQIGPPCICRDGWLNAGCHACRPVRSMAGFEMAEENVRKEMVK